MTYNEVCGGSGGDRVYERGPCDYKIKTHKLFVILLLN